MNNIDQYKLISSLQKKAEEQPMFDWGLEGYLGAGMLPGLANTALGTGWLHATSPLIKEDITPKHQRMFNAIARRRGVDIKGPWNPDDMFPYSNPSQEIQHAIREKIMPKWAKGVSMFNPLEKRIHSFPNRGVLAHEMGHALQKPGWLAANVLGKFAGGLGLTGTTLFNREEDARRSAILGTLGFGSTLANELDASARGAGILKRMGDRLPKRLKAFIGVPTYAMAAASPTIAYLVKKHMGGYDNE